ncbi:MAG: cytochrome P450 [Actinomycetota bacterium]|nr:cytochrome P450 [Actinomycetota bacterium]
MPDWTAWPFPVEDPYPAYRSARQAAPVQRHDDLGAVLVLSHEPAEAVLRNPDDWSSDPRQSPELLAALGGEGPMAEMWGRSLLLSDPPEHTRLRRAVSRFFTPRAMRAIAERVQSIVAVALEPLVDEEPVELMSQLAYPIPLAVIAELFDIGVEGAQLLRSETPALARMLELDPTPEILEAAGTAAMTLMLFLTPLLAQRRSNPGEDLLSALIHAPGGVELQTEEIMSLCLLLLAAGHETTANLIGNGINALLQHPDQFAWLRAHPDHCAQAVEELLRYDSPAQVASRAARQDLKLGPLDVQRGQQVLVILGAANRDPARHPDPDRLDLTRRQAQIHLAFGHGPHFCLGAGLARLEAAATFTQLARCTRRLELESSEHRRDPSRTLRRLRVLHVGASSDRVAGAVTPLPQPPRTEDSQSRYPRRAPAGSGTRP